MRTRNNHTLISHRTFVTTAQMLHKNYNWQRFTTRKKERNKRWNYRIWIPWIWLECINELCVEGDKNIIKTRLWNAKTKSIKRILFATLWSVHDTKYFSKNVKTDKNELKPQTLIWLVNNKHTALQKMTLQ